MESVTTALNTGLGAMNIELASGANQKLVKYLDQLVHWNRVYNLTAIRERQEMVYKHLLDSLAVLPYVGDGRLLDVGSGAGLPGIPLAIARPDVEFFLIDSNGKKTRFLTQVKIALKLTNVVVVRNRVEAYSPMKDDHRIYFDAVIARAFATTREILQNTAHLHKSQTRILIMQGKLDPAVDVAGYVLKRAHTLHVYGLEAERHLLEIEKT